MSSSPVEPLTTLELAAPAKINFYLRILGKRPDGYHELDSLMIKLEFGDRLVLKRRPTPGIEVRCPGSGLPTGPDNLVYKAAAAFYAHCGLAPALDIRLDKRIPVAAGLGGGSSDAAAVLRGLDQLYATGLGEAALLALARPLGADVPFFVHSAPAARARGVGEQLTPVPVPRGVNWIVLVNPGFGVSTQWVYDNFRLTKQNDPYIFTGSPAAPGNDLQAVTMAGYPELAAIRDSLLAAGAQTALMSGSGPTMFGVFADEQPARECAARMVRQYRHVYLTRPCWGVVKW